MINKNYGNLIGASFSLKLAELANGYSGLIVALVPDFLVDLQLETELKFFLKDLSQNNIIHFPDWETLPYDNFSPHQDIISERITTLYKLNNISKGILIVPISTALHRLCPKEYILQNTFVFNKGDKIDLQAMRRTLETAGYQFTHQVAEHGEFTVRGSILDLFPMGAKLPVRIDLFDDQIDSIRSFDSDTQRSIDQVDSIKLLPAREFPFDDKARSAFRSRWRTVFSGDPRACPVYQDVSQGLYSAGLEYYLPLFFENTVTLFDYFPEQSLIVKCEEIKKAADEFWYDVNERFEQYGHDITRPLLKPQSLFLAVDEIFGRIKGFLQVTLTREQVKEGTSRENLQVEVLPNLVIEAKKDEPLENLKNFINNDFKILICAETTGRKEVLKELLHKDNLEPKEFSTWHDFLADTCLLGLIVAPIAQGMILNDLKIAVIAESDLLGYRVAQQRRRKAKISHAENTIKNLAELNIGVPVVHVTYGVGRYLGLQKLILQEQESEFVVLEYANNDKLYVPVTSLHLISRYSGVDLEHAPLHHLGNERWRKDKQKALKQIRDVAAELLAIYAKREARKGFTLAQPDLHYDSFVTKFPFEETIDQEQAITQVIQDLVNTKPMDRVICGDVGFGKTEVAMRAAFLAVQSGKQVAMLVPTTLLAEQHYQTFIDRFADFPFNVAVISRFKSRKEQAQIIQALLDGSCDIIIGTHKLLQPEIKFKDLGLLIIDEEHRFGVRQKEKFKAFKAEVNILTLTATPIPRTLNMAMSGIRDLSIISTPPAKRLSVKTFVREYNKPLIQEAILRELRRGGQVYYLHNTVETIEKTAIELQDWIPSARIAVAHGQMPERELERVMSNFYHRHYNVLVCTTIIETGIDIPSANTIIIERADKFGLAQLHQLRGRVGRSHHQAYAFCLTPQKNLMTVDAVKRLEVIESLDTLGVGFALATHDLEIRGAGELLGDEQSGNIQSIGFNLYMELLDRAVRALKRGDDLNLDLTLPTGIEIDLQIAAFIPDDYISNVHIRLIQYKRIASATSQMELDELKIEMIDRFGLLPEVIKSLFEIARLKIYCENLGIIKVKAGLKSGKIEFMPKPKVDPSLIIAMVQEQPNCYKFDGPTGIKFYKNLIDQQQRVVFIEDVLKKLGGRLE